MLLGRPVLWKPMPSHVGSNEPHFALRQRMGDAPNFFMLRLVLTISAPLSA